MSTIDDTLGRLIKELKESGKLENTFIIYASDHDHMNEHHGLCDAS